MFVFSLVMYHVNCMKQRIVMCVGTWLFNTKAVSLVYCFTVLQITCLQCDMSRSCKPV